MGKPELVMEERAGYEGGARRVQGACAARPQPKSPGTAIRGDYSRTMTAILDPAQLRPLLHEEIDRASAQNLLLLHRVALQLELEEETARLDDGFDADAAAGKLTRLNEVIQEARAALRDRRPA